MAEVDFGGSQEALFQTIFDKKLTKGDRKKLEIVDMAVGLFGRQGVDATTYDEIAKALKTSRSHIKYHFKEREDLILTAVKYMLAKGLEFTFERLKGARTAEEQLIGYVGGYFEFFTENHQYAPLMLYFYYASAVRPEFRQIQTEVRNMATGRIKELIIQVLKAQGKRVPRKIDGLVYSVQTAILGGLIYGLATGKPLPEELLLTQQKTLAAIEAVAKVRLL